MFWPTQKFNHIQNIPSFFKNVFDLIGFAYVLRVRNSQVSFFTFPNFPRFHNLSMFFKNTLWKSIVLDPRKESQIYQKFKIPPKIILCFVVDIGTILAKFHSCVLVDIDPLSMLLEILLNGSSGFFGARLFKKSKMLEVRIWKNNIFGMFPSMF